MSIVNNHEVTPRESIQHDWDVDMFRLQAEHATTMKRLEIEQLKVEARWNSWLKLPAMIIRLPVWCILSIGYIISSIRNKNPDNNFWKLLNGEKIENETKTPQTTQHTENRSHEQ